MNAPAVSVILPTYNRASVLGRAIRSVLAQTSADLELIVVDDGSTDHSEEVVRAFDDPRLSYLPQPHTGSPAINRNIGIRAARAPLIAFQDSDDEWLIDKLARQLEAMREQDAGLVCGGYLLRSARGQVRYWGADARMQAGDWRADNIQDFGFIAPTWLIRRETLEAVDLFDEQMPNLEDWELFFRLYQQTRMIALNRPLVLKHGVGDGVDARPAVRIVSLDRIIQRHAGLWCEHPIALARLYDERGRLRCRQGDLRGGRSDLAYALRLHAGSLRRWSHWAGAWLGGSIYSRLRTLHARWRAAP